nr:zinc finger BED domain-containing protein RICESLEEPER 2-like [Ipomoea batatas]
MAEPNEPSEQIDLQTSDPQMEPDTTKHKSKKRKEMKDRSDVWVHFEKILDRDDKLIQAKCIYCKRVWAAIPKKHGTTNLRIHMVSCKQNPNIKNPGQTQFKVNKLLVNDKGESVLGQPSNWRFDHSYARKSIAEMIITDELPFSVVEKSGFKHFNVLTFLGSLAMKFATVVNCLNFEAAVLHFSSPSQPCVGKATAE